MKPADALASRVRALDWSGLQDGLEAESHARVSGLLDTDTCRSLRSCYDDGLADFRSTVQMSRHNYGRGEYRYFSYPLPPRVESLRQVLYPLLAAIANDWCAKLGETERWPAHLEELTRHCHESGQTRPTPLLLRYGPGDYNCLHQDVYGDILFPLQVIVLLSEPDSEFEGGELVLTEQRPRRQSRVVVVPLKQGEGVVVPVRTRPEPGPRGFRRVQVRHGVSTVRSGYRMTLGLIFHDAV